MSKNLVITEFPEKFDGLAAEVITFQQYLAEYPKRNEGKTRVINLCNTAQYLSAGYYCSLLAEARQHKVLPSVKSINDVSALLEQSVNGMDLDNSSQAKLNEKEQIAISALPNQLVSVPLSLCKSIDNESNHSFIMTLGGVKTELDAQYGKLAAHLFAKYSLPLMRVELQIDKNKQQAFASLVSVDIADLSEQDFDFLYQKLTRFIEKVWPAASRSKKSRWDMAILINPNEATPPSDKTALKQFVKAAARVGINAQLVTHDQILVLSRFDALFIRETTSIKSHTYAIARAAEKEGLVVIDDPTSILRCCNKVFLHDAFSYHKVPSPKTQFVTQCSDTTVNALGDEFGFPMVLKLPESAFSLGVYKVNNSSELSDKLNEMLAVSALVLVQEFLQTEFDWRIGVLDGRPLYACRYFMARNHWQIYNHNNNSESGDFDTLPTFEAPREVIEAALKACKFIGNGLYGVDIKQSHGKTYVIEVNDNPSIDKGVEDLYLGKELYTQIMQEFADRLEARGRK